MDLRGVVDLLSHHLYTSPRVYVRELLQNGVDAITARREIDPHAPDRILIEPPGTTGDGTLRVHDTGIGLTEPQVHELLATIGRSSKRDALGFARHDFLGQFGIGLLSCFLVADEIEVVTRSAAADGGTVVWHGHAEGRYTVTTGPDREEPGTSVILRPRPGAAHWLADDTVRELAEHYGGLLPDSVRVGADTVTGSGPPWTRRHPSPDGRRQALLDHGTRILGVRPFDVVDLNVPEAGLTGVAFVHPTEAHPGTRGAHHVYLKRMLLSDRVEHLLPEWAFFSRCVVDTSELRPTAGREQLYEDELLEDTREALGEQLRDWLVGLATTSPLRLREFLGIHGRGARALALHDDDMLRLVDQWETVETSDGWMTTADVHRRHPVIRYTPTAESFRQLGGIASAQGMVLVNGGHEYVVDILRRLPAIHPDVTVRALDETELATHFDPVETDPKVGTFLDAAAEPLSLLGCQPVVRSYDPASIPALYLESHAWRTHVERVAAHDEAEGAWSQVLGARPEPSEPDRPTLVFNHRNPLVRRLVAVANPTLTGLAVESLHGHALLAGQRPLRPVDVAALNRSFLGLLERAVTTPPEGL